MATVDYRMTNFDKVAFIGGLYVGRTTEEVKIFNSSGAFIGAISPSSLSTTGTLSVTGISTFGNGTAAAPSISFISDTDLGTYRAAANVLGITASGQGASNISIYLNDALSTTATFTIGRSVNTASTSIFGGDSNTTHAGVTFYGHSHATKSDITEFYNLAALTGSISSAGAWNIGVAGRNHIITGNSLQPASDLGTDLGATAKRYATTFASRLSSGASTLNLSSNSTDWVTISTAGVITLGSGSSSQHVLNTLLATNGSQTATMTNLPAAATAGNPAVWIKITVNGATRYIPAWA